MSSENGWIWWNYRTDLKEYYLVVTYEYCFSTRKDYFPLKQKIPETRFNQVLNKIEEIASRYYTRKLSSFLSVQLVSYNDCTPEQKYTLKLYDKKYRELNYIENSSNFLIAEVLTAIEIIEELDKEEFENGIIDVDCETVSELESASVPADKDSPAIPAAVARVKQPIGQNENYPSTWLFAKDDGAVPAGNDNGAAGMAQVGLLSSMLNAIENGFEKVAERQDKSIELQRQTANNTASVPVVEVPPAAPTSAPNASDSPAAPAPVPSDNDSPEDNKTVKPEMTQKKKGGRPTKEQEERICIAIIELFDSPKKSQIINSIKTLGDAVKKINRLLRESGIQIDERRLDGDKKPGRLFRYLWYFHTKIFRWGYREQNLEMDKDLIKEYRTKYKKYQDYLEK